MYPAIVRRLPRSNPSRLEDMAIELFGLTDNPEDVGFILTDGSMLDFQRSRGQGSWTEHEEVYAVYGLSAEAFLHHYGHSEAGYMPFLRNTGAIRVGLYGPRTGIVLEDDLDVLVFEGGDAGATRAQLRTARWIARELAPDEYDTGSGDRHYRGPSLAAALRVLRADL